MLTYREGVAQKIGHDLVIDVAPWEATVDVAVDGTPSAFTLRTDRRSLSVREGRRGVKPLTDKDRHTIVGGIDVKILKAQPISFTSRSVESTGGELQIAGELSLAGTARDTSFALSLGHDGRLTGTVSVGQTDWGIQPLPSDDGRAEGRDEIEVTADVQLRAA